MSYVGTSYAGWQRQPTGIGVQQVLEEALQKLLRRPVEVVGSGRTDAGVHATVQVVHLDMTVAELLTFYRRPEYNAAQQAAQNVARAGWPWPVPANPTEDTREEIASHCPVVFEGFEQVQVWRPKLEPYLGQLMHRLNGILPNDMAVHKAVVVPEHVHARFSATERGYIYRLHAQKQPLLMERSWFYPKALDVEAMNRAAALLLGTHDFKSFSKVHTDVKHFGCTITEAEWRWQMPVAPHEGAAELQFHVSANRFLRGMVRALVGTLVEVGLGRLSIEGFGKVVAAQSRGAAGSAAPAHGLYLCKVYYPELPNF